MGTLLQPTASNRLDHVGHEFWVPKSTWEYPLSLLSYATPDVEPHSCFVIVIHEFPF